MVFISFNLIYLLREHYRFINIVADSLRVWESLFFDYAPGPDLIYRARVQCAAVLKQHGNSNLFHASRARAGLI